ncbi:Interleukin-20 receptor subunit alpha, partial [Nibea albiflora]
SYGDRVKGSNGTRAHWRPMRHCTEIMRRWCDLSDETWDIENSYYARVRAVSRKGSSKWVVTRRFDPKSDTSFGPPLVSVEIDNNSANVTLKGPMRYQPNNHTPEISMAALYPQMMYNLSIRNSQRSHASHFLVISSLYKYRLMEHDTEYCFSAQAKFLSMPVQCQASAWQCITTPPDPVVDQLKRVVVGVVVPSVCMCMLTVAGYLLYHYLMGKGKKSPYILSPPSFSPPPLTFPPESLNPIFITVIQPSDIKSNKSDSACSKQQKHSHTADPPPGYTPQRPEPPPEPEEPWDDESIDYGFVGAAPKIIVRGVGEEKERRCDSGEDGNNLKGKHQKDEAKESYTKKEWRADDGIYAPQAKSCLTQRTTHTCSQTHMPMHTQTERSTLVQAQAYSDHLTQTQTPLLSIQETREVDRDGGMEEESMSESAPLLSAYASQNINTTHADQSDFLLDDYGVLRLATAEEIENDDGDEEEEEEGTICIDWDPHTRKLVMPEVAMEFTTEEGGLDGLMQREKGWENRVGGEEEVSATKGELTLENVYVRQASEEEAEAQRERESGGVGGWEAEDLLTKWNLVISMDQ